MLRGPDSKYLSEAGGVLRDFLRAAAAAAGMADGVVQNIMS